MLYIKAVLLVVIFVVTAIIIDWMLAGKEGL